MFCPQCGNNLPEDARFCDNCGHNLNAAEAPSTTANQASPAQDRPRQENQPQAPPAPQAKKGFNPALLVIPLVIIIVAAAVFLFNQDSTPTYRDYYQRLLQEYVKALNSFSTIAEYQEAGISSLYNDYAAADIGYTLQDLDYDDIPELIISAFGEYTAGQGLIFDLYTFKNGELQFLLSSDERDSFYLCTDGSIANMGSSGADDMSWCNYVLDPEDGQFILWEEITSLGYGDLYYYSFMDEIPDVIEGYEAWEIIDACPPQSLDLKPLTQAIS